MPDLLVVLIVILVLAIIWRGPKTLPRLGEALGRGVREARQQAARRTDDHPTHDAGAADANPARDGDPRT